MKIKAEADLLTRTARWMLLAGMSLDEGAAELKTRMIELKLKEKKGNVCHTARELHVHRNTMSRKISEAPRLRQTLQEVRERTQGSRFARRKANQLAVSGMARRVA